MTQQHIEVVKAALDFKYFLKNHVSIRDVKDRQTRVIQWEWWPFHDQMCADFANEDLLAILKARQLGLSWALSALHVWDAMFTENYLGAIISAGQGESTEFLSKCRFIIDHLPKHLYGSVGEHLHLETDNTEEISFKATGGKIMAFPSTPKAGIGFTFSRLVVDEAAFHPFAEQNYANYAAAGEQGQIIVCSSTGAEEKRVTSDWFQRLWLGAPDNGFTPRFYPFNFRPGRDEDWYQGEVRKYRATPGAVQRLYPRSPEDAFSSMLSLRFDTEAVKEARDICRDPLREVSGLPQELNVPYLRLWSLPRPGVAYVSYTDPALGVKRDYTVTAIMEARTRRHVATLRENVLEPTQHGSLAAKLCRWFDVKIIGVEREKGEAVLAALNADEWCRARLYWHEAERNYQATREHREASKRLGFPMTEHTRKGLIDDLGQAIVDRSMSSDDTEFWRECSQFIVKPGLNGREGRPEAMPGAHDDLVIVLAGLLRMSAQPGAQAQPAGRTITPPYNEPGSSRQVRYSEHGR